MALVRFAAGLTVLVALSLPVRASGSGDIYALRTNIKIGVAPSSHATVVDGAARRAYVATGRGLFAVDLDKRSVIGAVAPLRNVRGLTLVRDRQRLVAALADGNIAIVDLASKRVTRRPVGGTPAGEIVFDAATATIFVLTGNGTSLAAVNLETAAVEATIPLAQVADQITAAGGRVFALLRDNRLQMIDTSKREVAATWPLRNLPDSPPVLAADATGTRVFVGAETEIFMIAGATGEVLGRISTPSRVVSLGYDARRSLMVATSYRSEQPGTLTVAREEPGVGLRVVEQLDLPRGAGGLNMDPATGIFTVSATDIVIRDSSPAIASPTPVLRSAGSAPGSFLLLLYEHSGG